MQYVHGAGSKFAPFVQQPVHFREEAGDTVGYGEVTEADDLNERRFEPGVRCRLQQESFDLLPGHVVAERQLDIQKRARRSHDAHRMGDQVEIGQGREVPLLRLDLRVQQVHRGDAPEVIADRDVVARTTGLDGLQHDAGHDVAHESRGRQRDRRAEDDAVQAEQLTPEPAVQGQEQDQHEDNGEYAAELDQLPPEIEMGLAFEVLDQAFVGDVCNQSDDDDRRDRLQDNHQNVHVALADARRFRRSLIRPATVSQPAVGMPTLRVVVRPVNHATSVVSRELPVELHRVAFAYSADAGRQVDIVCNQQCPSVVETKDEALMAAAVIVIGKDAHDRAGTAHLLTVAVVRAGFRNARRGRRRPRRLTAGRIDELVVQVRGGDYDKNRENSLHGSNKLAADAGPDPVT